MATRASSIGELLAWWLPAVLAAIVVFVVAAVVRGERELPKIIGPLAALAIVALLVRGVAEFVWIGLGRG